jgi:hypothetical protein
MKRKMDDLDRFDRKAAKAKRKSHDRFDHDEDFDLLDESDHDESERLLKALNKELQ